MLRPEVPFTASVSGDMYFVMGRLSQYMSDNAKDPNLQKNVSEFLRAVISVYAKNGNHHNFEIKDVFAEPAVRQTFQKFGIQPDLSYSPENLSAAMQATIRYTAAYAQKRAMQEELPNALWLRDFALSFPVVHDSSSSDSEGSSPL